MTEFESRSADWLGYREALARILADVRPLDGETLPVDGALGRALAEDVDSPVTLPPWDNSAMDGYAVRADDIAHAAPTAPVHLVVDGEVQAGAVHQGPVEAGHTLRIMTGAPVPEGADCVVRVEDTEAAPDGGVWIRRPSPTGSNIRPAGADLVKNQRALTAGLEIGPGAVAVLASVGRTEVRVGRRPLVAIVTSGTELVRPSEISSVEAGLGIVDSNGPMLAAQARQAGADVLSLGPAKDTRESVREHLEAAGGADLIVTVGGASMGTADLFKRVQDEMGYELDFWRIRIRPGSPVSFGQLSVAERRVPVLGLPGNPGSALVTFELFARPYLRTLAGFDRVLRPRIVARTAEPFRASEKLTVFLRVQLIDRGGTPEARLTGPQASGLVSGLALADGLAVHPEGTAVIPAGEAVQVMPLHSAWA